MLRIPPYRYGDVAALGGAPSWVLRSGGVAATMDIDFLNDRVWNGGALSTVAAMLACSRASTKYVPNAAGSLLSFSSNVLPYTSLGLLVEESRINIILRSQQFGTSWSVGGGSISSDTQTAPDGTATADTYTENTSTSAHYNDQTFGGTGGTRTFALSCYFKAGTQSYAYLQILRDSQCFVAAVFDLGGGTVSQTAVGATSGTVVYTAIEALANGWYRCVLVGTSAGTNLFPGWGLAPAASGNTFGAFGQISYLGASKTLHAWGYQCEEAANHSSYIPTTTGSVTRAADVITFSDLTWLDGSNDSLYAEWIARNVNNAKVWALDATNDKLIDEQTGMSVRIAGATAGNTASMGATVKAAARLKLDDYAISMNGGTVATDVSETAPGTLSASRLGCDLAGANHLNNYIRRVTAFKGLAIANADLVTLAT